MNQVLHIFRKDTRRFWPEIVAVVIIIAGFVVAEPNTWRFFRDPDLRMRFVMIGATFLVLLPVSWWILTGRAVQEETLVGDRQFWITRPYKWNRLLVSKVLLVLAWIALPWFIAQFVLLKEAGFPPFEHVATVTCNTLIVAGVLIVPVLALAAVTSTLVRLVLSILGCFVAFVAFMSVATLHQGYNPHLPYENPWGWVVLIVGCAGILIFQYAARRAWLSRGLLVAVPALMLVMLALFHRQSLVDRAYPAPAWSAASILTSEIAATDEHPVDARSWRGWDYLDLPLRYGGVADGYAVALEDVRFSLTSADGTRWNSPWQGNRDRVRVGERDSILSLMLRPEVYERFKSGPVSVHVEFAVSRYQIESTATVPFPEREEAFPGIGYCAPAFMGPGTLACRSGVIDPPLTYVSAQWQQASCSEPAPASGADSVGGGWNYVTGLGFPLSSVRTGVIVIERPHQHWNLCPGSPVTLTEYRLVDRTRAEMTVPNFQLPEKVKKTD